VSSSPKKAGQSGRHSRGNERAQIRPAAESKSSSSTKNSRARPNQGEPSLIACGGWRRKYRVPHTIRGSAQPNKEHPRAEHVEHIKPPIKLSRISPHSPTKICACGRLHVSRQRVIDVLRHWGVGLQVYPLQYIAYGDEATVGSCEV
jgi:hypothetical protein